jgi:hypothetical protein
MKLLHNHDFVILSAYDRDKVVFPGVLATVGTEEEDLDLVEVTDVLQQCSTCKALRYNEFNGHHAESLTGKVGKNKNGRVSTERKEQIEDYAKHTRATKK